ncbi:MAG: SDR family oxidoreductase [Chloroflexi bacterium]|nr:SDR family oxidoreductase [Chloroflexota bacterium]
MQNTLLRGKTALVTGASSGLGVDFARQLAEYGCHLLLVARREDRLHEVAQAIISQYGVEVTVLPLDLGAENAAQVLYDQIKAQGKVVDVLINNAGFGVHGPFVNGPWGREKAMLELDIITVVHLTKLFVSDMLARNFGYILQVASSAAYQPVPGYAAYGAAKSFVLNFGEALSYELRKTNVHCTVLSPGVTATEFFQVSGQPLTLYQRLTMLDSPTVARIGIKALLAGRPSVVAGAVNATLAWANRFAPRRLAVVIADQMMNKA